MIVKPVLKIAPLAAIATMLIGSAIPASAETSLYSPLLSAQSSESGELSLSSQYSELSSQYTREQGLFSQHTLAIIRANFNPDLTDDQRHAIWFGPTTEEDAAECREKYGLDGDGPWLDIMVQMDCSVEVIEASFYDESVDIALGAPINLLSGVGSSTE